MVETFQITTLVKGLEKFFLRRNKFKLNGESYDLILFRPLERYSPEPKYSLYLSAKIFDGISDKILAESFFKELKEFLSVEYYKVISGVTFLKSNYPLVKNLKTIFAWRAEVKEISDIAIGGYEFDYALIVKSLVLDKLIVGNAVTFQMADGNSQNAGIIEMDEQFNIIHYTGKGLRENYPNFELNKVEQENANELKALPRNKLIAEKYIAITPLDKVIQIL